MNTEAPRITHTTPPKVVSDTGASPARVRKSAKKTREAMITAGECAALPVRELTCKQLTKSESPIDTAMMPSAFDFDVVKVAAQAEKRLKLEGTLDYAVRIPCCACMNCIIVRIFDHGRLYDESYNCLHTKRKVERFGSCNNGKEGQGPNVIVVNPKLEMLAERTSAGEVKEFPRQVTEIPNYDIKDMQSQPKLKSQKEQDSDKK